MSDVAVGRLVALLGVNTAGFSAGLARAENLMGRTSARLSKIGKTLSRNITLPLAIAAGAATKFAVDFEAEMVKIETLVGVQPGLVKEWNKALLEMSPAVGRGPVELARALFVITSAGQRGAESLEILESAAKASVVGLGDTATVARAVTSAMQAYSRTNLSAARATEVLISTVREGNLEATGLAASLGRVLGVASQMGVTFEQVGAFIATFTRVGVSAQEAVTSLRSTLLSLLKPVGSAKDALAELDETTATLRESIRERGLAVTLVDLIDRLSDLGEEAVTQVIPNLRALAGVLAVASAQGGVFVKIAKNIADSTGIMTETFGRARQTTRFQFDALKSQLSVVAITIGTVLLPSVNSLLSVFSRLAKSMNEASDATKKLVGNLTLLAATVGPLVLLSGGFAKLGQSIASVGKFLVRAGAAVAAFFALSNKGFLIASELYNALATAVKFIGRAFLGLGRFVLIATAVVLKFAFSIAGALAIAATAVAGLILTFTGLGSGIRDSIAGLPLIGNAIDKLVSKAKLSFLGLVRVIVGAFGTIADAFSNIADKTPDIFGSIKTNIVLSAEKTQQKVNSALEKIDLLRTKEVQRRLLIDLEVTLANQDDASSQIDRILEGNIKIQKSRLQEIFKVNILQGRSTNDLDAFFKETVRIAEEIKRNIVPALQLSKEEADALVESFFAIREALPRIEAPQGFTQDQKEAGEEMADIVRGLQGEISKLDLTDFDAQMFDVRVKAEELAKVRFGDKGKKEIDKFLSGLDDLSDKLKVGTGVKEIEAEIKRLEDTARTANLKPFEAQTVLVRESLIQLGKDFDVPIDQMDEFLARFDAARARMKSIAESIRIDVGAKMSSAFSEMFKGILRGTRDSIDAGELFATLWLQIIEDMFAQTLKAKIKFELAFEGNILSFGKKIAKEIGQILGLIPKDPAASATPGAAPNTAADRLPEQVAKAGELPPLPPVFADPGSAVPSPQQLPGEGLPPLPPIFATPSTVPTPTPGVEGIVERLGKAGASPEQLEKIRKAAAATATSPGLPTSTGPAVPTVGAAGGGIDLSAVTAQIQDSLQPFIERMRELLSEISEEFVKLKDLLVEGAESIAEGIDKLVEALSKSEAVDQATEDLLVAIRKVPGVFDEGAQSLRGGFAQIVETLKRINEDLEEQRNSGGGGGGGGIPFFGEGGFVTKPTLAVIGEKGPELVIPQKKLPDFGIGKGVSDEALSSLPLPVARDGGDRPGDRPGARGSVRSVGAGSAPRRPSAGVLGSPERTVGDGPPALEFLASAAESINLDIAAATAGGASGSKVAQAALSVLSEEIDIPALGKGGIATSPLLAIVGDKQPEAIVPLPKLEELGGGGETIIQIFSPDEPVKAVESRGPDGRRQIRLLVGRAIEEDLATGGRAARTIQSTFGTNRRTLRR